MNISRLLLLFILFAFLLFGLSHTAYAVMKPNAKADKTAQLTLIQQESDQKLTFKEKIGLAIVKKRLKKNNPSGKQEIKPGHGLAIGGLLSGILSLFILGIPFSILGLILSLVGLQTATKQNGAKSSRGIAIAGLFISAISLFLTLTFLS